MKVISAGAYNLDNNLTLTIIVTGIRVMNLQKLRRFDTCRTVSK